MKNYQSILVTIILAISTHTAHADSITLQNGQKIEVSQGLANETPTYHQGFRFGLEIYGKTNAYDTIKDTFESNVKFLGAQYGHAEGEFNVSSLGLGLTAGYVFAAPTENTLEHGPQVQFIAAPSVDVKLRVTNANQSVVYADQKDTILTSMWRLTWQFGVPIKLQEHLYFIPRADAGVLLGKMYLKNDSSSEQTWSGMTFSLAPSLLLGKSRNEKGAHFEVGASYTYIPPKKQSDSFDEFSWNALGVNAGFLWLF